MRGEAHYAARLTADDVRLIRALGEERARLLAQARQLSDSAIAEKFGVHPSAIKQVLSYRTWGHVR